ARRRSYNTLRRSSLCPSEFVTPSAYTFVDESAQILATSLTHREPIERDRQMALLFIAALVLPGEHPGSPVQYDVAQIVLEKMIADSAVELVLCIDVNGADPPGKLLDQLQRPGRVIVSGSKCHRATDGGLHPSYFGKSRRRAHFLTVSDAIQISRTEMTVQANDWYHMKWASYWTVRLAHDDSGWHI